jgi:transcriptional regulator with GAF, ATPase, and Fis domain
VNDTNRCRYLTAAGDLHLEAFRTEEALQCYRKVLDDLSGQTSRDADHLFAATAIKYSKISTGRHDTEKVLDILRSALARAQARDLKGFQAILSMHLAKNEWLRSQYSSALRHFEEGWGLAKDLNDPKILRAATTFSTFFLFWQGRFREAIQSHEKSAADIEKYPSGGFPLLSIITVGYCYAQIGYVTQGLGMLDAIRTQCLEQGNLYLSAYAAGNIGNVLLDIGRIDEAIEFIQLSAKEARQVHNDWVWITGKIGLAYAYFLKGETTQSLHYLHEFLEQSRKVQVTVYLYPYLMELCLAMEQGKLPATEGLSLAKEVREVIQGENIFLKGVGYRVKAILAQMKGASSEEVLRSYEQSLELLTECGSQVELANSRFWMARHYIEAGDEEKARQIMSSATDSLEGYLESLIPDDLRTLVTDKPAGENLLKEILNLGQQVVTIRNYKDLVQHILSTVNRLTGAERGAIFRILEDPENPKLTLMATKNLTPDQITQESFASSMKMIQEVAEHGTGRILALDEQQEMLSESTNLIRSRVCVPMILRDKIFGVLYHDNRLLSSAFKESDLALLSYFAALAAFALDNARAYDEIKRLNAKLSEENLYYKEENLQNLHFDDIVGESSAIKRVLSQIDQVAATEATVMILGETGVGKELVARAIHRNGLRRDKPFIRVHCSALPESLIPSELFGHEKGAFTGANRRRLGRFELADGGTLFLDEIGDISQDIQVRLLRVLQTKEFERVGGSETLRSDFRLVVATNRDLEQRIRTQKFRADLYYRLAVFPIFVPPLRERREDIPILAHYFLKIYSNKMRKDFSRIPHSEMEKLVKYHWPGNVRELENVIERGAILSSEQHFRVPELGGEIPEHLQENGETTLRENERRHIIWALEKTGWKVRGRGGAAELLDLPPSTLAFRMKKLGIHRQQKPVVS